MATSLASPRRSPNIRAYRPQANASNAGPLNEPANLPAPSAPQFAPYDPRGGMPDTSGYNLYGESAGGTPISQMAPGSVPYYGGDDLAKQYVNNRNMQQNQGDIFQGYFGGEASRRAGLENAALLKSQQLQGQLEQYPGYTPEEAEQITRSQQYQDLLGADYMQNYLTPEERQAIMGDPMGAVTGQPNLTDINKTAFEANQGTIAGTGDVLKQNREVLGDRLNSAIDRGKLGMSGIYDQATNNVLTTTGNRVWDAATNPELNMDEGYRRTASMSDQETSDIAAMGGQDVGARYRAASQDVERQAAASGNASPLAVAAMKSQLLDQSAVGSAEAAVRAQIQARQAQMQAAQNVENTRSEANRYKTGAQIGGAEAMGQLATNSLNAREGIRLGAEQDISNRQLGAASQVGQYGNENAQYLADRNLQNEDNWANRQLGAATFGYGAQQTAEQRQADRALALATNRQGVSQGNQANQFGRGYQVNATQSQLGQQVADARRQGQQESRNYYQGQQQYQGGMGQQEKQNLLTNRQQTQTGVNQATQGSAAWELGNKNAPNWFTKNVVPAVNAATGFGNMMNQRPKSSGG